MTRLTFLALLLSFNHRANGFLNGPFSSRVGLRCEGRTVRSTTPRDDGHGEASIGGQPKDNSVVGKIFEYQASRRDYIVSSVIAATSGLILRPDTASAEYKAAVRPTAYRVDSTIPPSLLPIADNKKNQILAALGKGSGTDKDAVFIDTVNLNNMLNKAVFGTINAVSSVGNPKESVSGPGFASFVCMGLPSEKSDRDIILALQLLEPMVKQRKGMSTAMGLGGVPYSTQATLDAYTKGDLSIDDLASDLQNAGVETTDIELYKPLIEWTKKNSLDLLALAPEREDAETARKQGLQFVDSERRSSYVVDPEGFIGLTQDPRFKMYTDRSLLKDFSPRSDKETAGNFYAERILVHEAGATAAAKYASTRPDSLVVMMSPVNDVRFLNGINGRIPRVFSKLRPEDGKVSEDYVTTILLNPTARDTLSKSNYIRLEIGTSPDILDYQTKVADYLWFSSSPKVNQIPRLVNG
eukprot:scaffold3502_cov183-Amphora_coffeaeformis.AAC.2